MIPGIELSDAIAILGYGVCLIIFAETGLLVGFFLPGDSLLFTAGALTGLGILKVNIFILAPLFLLAAILGNSTGYLIGRHFGRRHFKKDDSRLFKKKYLIETEKFYLRHGPKAVILAQFMPILRTFNPIVAGISKMRYVKFIMFNVIGACFWTLSFSIVGYYIFKAFGKLIDPEKIDYYILPIIVLIVFLSILPGLIHVLKRRAKSKKKP
jgi:membrane-associated protein